MEETIHDALLLFLDKTVKAAELDRQIAFPDRLIDQVVYRMFELNEEEVGLVEST